MTTTPTFWGNEITFSNVDGSSSQAIGLADGTFAIVWTDGENLFGVNRDENGNVASGNFMSAVSNRMQGDLYGPQIVQQVGGTLVVDFGVVLSQADTDIFGHHVSPNFVPSDNINGRELLPTPEHLYDTTATASGGTANVFAFTNAEGATNLMLRFYSDGSTAGSRIPVGEHPGQQQSDATVVGLVNGNVAVVYKNFDPATLTREVRLHIFTPNGADVAGEITVSNTANAAFPDAAVLKNGSFVVAYQDVTAGGVFFRRYDEAGNAIDEQPKMIPGTNGGCITPKVTALQDGGFIVAWNDFSAMEGDGSREQETFLQRFYADGSPAGVKLEIDLPGDQILSSIATLDDGRVIITYSSETGDSTDVFTQNYRIVDPREKTIVGSSGADNIVSREDGATLIGRAGNDRLTGRDGRDELDGGEGADLMRGGRGSDVYKVDNANDLVIEIDGEGGDTVLTAIDYTLAQTASIEVLATIDVAATTPISLTGNQYAQTIQGNAGANILKGGGPGGAADELVGMGGNDRYIVYNAGDIIFETATEGTADRVLAGVNYALGAGVHIEMLTTNSGAGTAAINLTGNELKQEIIGNAGANILHSGGGAADLMQGLGGNDTYRVFNSDDVIIETGSQGAADRVMAAVDYRLGTGVHVEILTTNGSTGTTAIDLTGNEIAQEIIGNAGSNTIDGRGGSDSLRGGSGQDFFVFSTALGAGNVDRITDFSVAADTIGLASNIFRAFDGDRVMAGNFRANTTGRAQDANDFIIYETDTGKLFYDADGTGALAGIHFATLTGGLALTYRDFQIFELE